jgi:hypothetical protein
MADETDKTKLPSPIPDMNLADFEATFKLMKEEIAGWDEKRRSFVINILLDESIRGLWKGGGAPAVIMYGMALANTMNNTLSKIYKEEGIQPVDLDKLEVQEIPYIDRNKMN